MEASRGTQKKTIGTLSDWLISRKLFPNSLSRHFCGYKARHFTILSAPSHEAAAQHDPALKAGVPAYIMKYLTENISLLLVRSPAKSTLKGRFTGKRYIHITEFNITILQLVSIWQCRFALWII